MIAYKRHVRSVLALATTFGIGLKDSEHLFISKTGGMVESSNIHTVMKNFLSRTGVKLDKPFMCTSVRKVNSNCHIIINSRTTC